MKIVTVIGARPQFIKAGTVSRVLALRDDVSEVIIHTGQHYDTNMSDTFFNELSIPCPSHNLGIGGGHHGAMTARQLEAVEAILMVEMPEMVLVYGDTNSTLAGGLAAAKLNIPVTHVEAGLRSFNRRMPEEINRILTDQLSEILFAPTETAMNNLRAEGFPEERLSLVGDVMYDAMLFYRERAYAPNSVAGMLGMPFVLATIHRAENTDDETRLASILAGLDASPYPVILPMHPRTRARIVQFDLAVPKNIYIIDPVGYLEMIWLEMNATLITTDSGGVQKEAYFHGKPCITLREETEWTELVEAGWNVLAGANTCAIQHHLNRDHTPGDIGAFYGDGESADVIVRRICDDR